ncbi:rhodanese-like domain-containing protein [Cellvibrio zantedeschiae]|uniref:Rhodanese-like domain-containing protein n=1 Tax=Cellvibrio zantedeschiae TaxID=1237077 RepID=A0ABQ3BCA0_9GAMM|nr:rhodanese-like domain-containing protein [Cellvibrio zantedeschiae]GGY84026.1 rhodanese-like domain-containing protein [Cellvibrio zantedeschiae]
MNFIQFLIQEWILTSLLAVLIIVYVMRERVKSGVPVTNNQLTALVNSDKAVILDIRPSAEFKAGHLVDAINIPYERINSDLATLEKYKSKTIIIVDKMGQYAGVAGRQLAKEGFEVRRLSGGISEWQNQNLPLVKGK